MQTFSTLELEAKLMEKIWFRNQNDARIWKPSLNFLNNDVKISKKKQKFEAQKLNCSKLKIMTRL